MIHSLAIWFGHNTAEFGALFWGQMAVPFGIVGVAGAAIVLTRTVSPVMSQFPYGMGHAMMRR